jgi:hypothetical protein
VAAYYEGQNNLQTELWPIVRRYLRGWFWIDLLSSIPLEGNTNSDFVNLVRLCKLCRFFRYATHIEAKVRTLQILSVG